MPDRPTLADLKALSAALPPTSRLQSSETADVLSAVAAVLTHGRDIIDAAKQGSTGVYDFLHQQAVDHAEANGHPAPERGAVVTDAGTPAPPAQSASIDYDQLAAAIVRQQTVQAQADAATAQREATSADTPPDEHPATTADSASAESQDAVTGDPGDGIL